MPIDQHGFLGRQVKAFREEVRRDYAPLFDLCSDLNDFSYRELLALQAPQHDGQKVTAVALLIKVLTDCQATVLLLERGLVLQAEHCLRAALEACFHLTLLCRESVYLQEFIQRDNFDVKRILHGATQLVPRHPKALEAVDQAQVERRLAQARTSIKEQDLQEARTEKIACRAGLADLYNSFYRFLCLATHAAPRALERYIEATPEGTPTGFRWGPETKSLDDALMICALAYLVAWKAVGELFALREPKALDEFDRRATSTVENMQQKP